MAGAKRAESRELISPATNPGGSAVTANVDLTGIPRIRGRRRQRRDRYVFAFIAIVLVVGTLATCASAWSHRSVVNLVLHPAAAQAPNAADFDHFDFSMLWLGLHRQPALAVRAQAAYLVDLDTRLVLWAKDPETSRAPASLTKLMTAIVAVDDAGTLDRVVTVPPAAMHVVPSLMGVTTGGLGQRRRRSPGGRNRPARSLHPADESEGEEHRDGPVTFRQPERP